MSLIDEIEKLRKRKGLTKTEMAGRFGVTYQNYHNWIARSSLPKSYYEVACELLKSPHQKRKNQGILHKQKVGVRLKSEREKFGFSLKSLSLELKGKYSASRLGNYEQGIRMMPAECAASLSNIFNCSPSYLLCIGPKYEGFGARFNQACHAIGKENCSQNELGRIFGVSGPMISNYRNGHKLPAMETACKICEITGVQLDWLMYGKPNKEDIRKAFSDRLIEALDAKGVESTRRAATLARWVGKNPKNPEFARKWLTARSMPQKDNLSVVAKNLGVREEWLEYGAGSKAEVENLTPAQQELLKAYLKAPESLQAGVRKLLDVQD